MILCHLLLGKRIPDENGSNQSLTAPIVGEVGRIFWVLNGIFSLRIVLCFLQWQLSTCIWVCTWVSLLASVTHWKYLNTSSMLSGWANTEICDYWIYMEALFHSLFLGSTLLTVWDVLMFSEPASYNVGFSHLISFETLELVNSSCV